MRYELYWRLLGATLLIACGDDPKHKLGETCSADYQCESGLCMQSQCLDPEADNDGDGLVNRIEDGLGTNALLKDSDADGLLNQLEVGDVAAATDFDGDGFIDAIESALKDGDGDCIPDQRDALDQTPEGDLGKVAELACCCQGACSSIGVTAHAICQAGVLTCTPSQPDRDGDRVADACDTPDIALGAADVTAGCEAACADISTQCDGAPPACVADCSARASDEGLWLSNYVCLASTCDEASCFEPPGFAEDAKCKKACAAAVQCNLGPALGGDAFNEARCRAECAGEYEAVNSSATAVFECLAGLPAGACRLVDALSCVVGADTCDQACAKLGEPAGSGTCRGGAPVFDAYDDQAACVDACTPLGGFGEVAFLGCASVRGCSAFGDTCDANPNAVATGCEAPCTALATSCATADSLLSDASMCGAYCTGVTLAAPWIVPADAVTCIERADACDEAGEAAAVLTTCLLGATVEPRCASTCERLETCADELQRPVPPDCEAGCTGLVLTHPERIEPTFSCLAEAATCIEVPGCLPPSVDDVCAPACNHVLQCSPNYLGGLAQCQADCRTNLGASLDNFAAWMCESQATSCETACGDLPGIAPEATCVDACAGKDTCIEAGYGLCERACQGVLRAYGETTSTTCMRDNLGRRCNAIAVKACDPR